MIQIIYSSVRGQNPYLSLLLQMESLIPTLKKKLGLGNDLMTNNFSQGLVLAFTKNDDSETFIEVLQLLRDASLSFEVSEASENPIVAASLASDIKCMRLLYKAGYRVRLAEKDWKLVKNLIKTPETRIPIRKKSETKRKLEDPVIRFLQFKAFANPLYLSLQLAESREQRRGEVKPQWEALSSET